MNTHMSEQTRADLLLATAIVLGLVFSSPATLLIGVAAFAGIAPPAETDRCTRARPFF